MVLDSKYGSWRGLGSGEVRHFESFWWRDLKRVCGRENEGRFDDMAK